MNNEHNPYAAPQSSVTADGMKASGKVKMYSPKQAATAAFLAGPLAGAYAIRKNFEMMGNHELVSKTMLIAVLITLVLIGITPFLPEHFPSVSLGVLWTIGTLQVMKKYMPSTEQIRESDEYEFQSNWSVFAVTIGSIIVMVILFFAWFIAASAIGLVKIH